VTRPPDLSTQLDQNEKLNIMNDIELVENVIFGGGEPGKYIAWGLAQQGRPAVVIERALIGGSCPNIACLPSKNVIQSAKVSDLLHHAHTYGLQTGPVVPNMKGVRQRKREMVDDLIAIHRKDRPRRRARRAELRRARPGSGAAAAGTAPGPARRRPEHRWTASRPRPAARPPRGRAIRS
jgi:hypothetical protein